MKKETIEEAVEKYVPNPMSWTIKEIFKDGAKWQQKNSYSESEYLNVLIIFAEWYNNSEIIKPRSLILKDDIQVFISEQFKKK